MRTVSSESYKRERKKKTSRNSSGDNIWFFVLTNIISVIVFFLLVYRFNLLQSIQLISELVSGDFFYLFVKIFLSNTIASLIGWMVGYILLRIIKIYVLHTRVKTFGDMNRGLNRFPLTSLAFFIATAINSLLFAIGALTIMQNFLFGSISIVAMTLTYLLLKLFVYILTKMIIESKF